VRTPYSAPPGCLTRIGKAGASALGHVTAFRYRT